MSEYDDYEFVSVEVLNRIATITFNRPSKLNACRVADHAELPRLLKQLQADDDVLVSVVRGAGRAFSVGGDIELLEQVSRDDELLHSMLVDGRELVHAHVAMDKPIIAAVHGYAMGAGLAFALLCDFIYVEAGTLLADGHMRAAIAAGDVGTLAWPLAVGMIKAKRFLLTGDWITAEEAERIGLVTEVVEPGGALIAANAMALRLRDGPQNAIRYTKAALNQWLKAGIVTTFDYSVSLEVLTFRSEDFRKALPKLRNSESAMPGPDQ